MLRFVLYLLTALDLALVVLGGGQIHPSRIPMLPPPPTFTPVGENNTILVPIGENVVVHENVRVTMDCIELIQNLTNLGEENPHITWIKNTAVIGRNESEVNVFISGDERYCITSSTQLAVGGQLGTTGNYTCKVCGGDGTVDCVSKTSSQVVCGVPHIQKPLSPAIVFPTFISLTCGENVTVESFVNITTINVICTVFNGSEPWNLSIYKDGNLTNYATPFIINNPTDEIFGTFTFVVETEYCGSATVISTILPTGVPPDIDEGPNITRPDTITEGNKRVTIGSPAYVLLGYNVTIDCNASGTPPIFITWVHNELIIAGDVNTITITDAKDGDVITCRADNNIGFDEERTTINVIACDLTCDTVGTLKEENCSCQCLPGYTGSKCETNINECDPDPCQHGGTCTDDINGYNCTCVPGYTGIDCETNIDECATNPCLSDGTCTDGVNEYTCECVAGFTGNDCETNIDECAPNPCLNGGTCIDGINSYTCHCAEDFTNVNCFEYIGACPDNYRTVSVSFDQSSYTVSEGDGSVEFKLALSSPLGCNCYARVVVTTDDATAKRDSDYEHEDDYIEVIFINGMVTSEPFYIKMTDNDDFEDDKMFRVTIDPLSLPYGTTLGSGGSANVIIKDDEEATVRFKEADIAASESDGLVKPVLVLSKAPSVDIIITITTAPGSTSAECDYNHEPFNVTIPAGEKEWPFDANIIYDDDIYESDEHFVLVIDEDSLPDRIEREEPYRSTVTIEDDEEKITVNFDDPSYNIKESDGVVEISLSLDKPSPCCLHVLVEFVNGTAIGQGVDYDYERRKLNITFPAGVTCSRFNVPIINDELSENDETFYIIIMDKSLPYGITIGDHGTTNVTIVDNDVYVSFASQTFENHEDEGQIEVEVKLDKIAQTDTIVTVDVDTANGAEGNGIDYDFEAHNVTIQEGTDSAKFNVTIIDDIFLEHDETFNLTITQLYSSLPYEIYLGQPNTTKIIILDNEYIVTFNEPSLIVNEADFTLVLAVKVNKKIRKDIHMTFLYNGLIATENEDYEVNIRNATIEAGNTHYELTINIIDDDKLEDNELVRITILPSVIPTKHNPGSVDITIIDDDDYKIYFEKATYIDKKNEQTIPVLLLTYPSNHDELVRLNMSRPPFNVTIDEVDVTARGGSEGMDGLDYYYIFKNRTISFNDGEKMKSLSEIRSIDDNLVEGDETFDLIINSESLPENFIAERNGTTTIVIQNDDVCFLRLDSGGMSFSKPLAADISMNITYFDKQRNTTVTTTDTIMAAETDSRDPVPLIDQTHDIEKIEVFIPFELYIPDDERQNIKSSSPEKIFLTKPT